MKELDDEIFLTIQDKLDELLPEAFAVVKEVCKKINR